jgi:hypothetical protein
MYRLSLMHPSVGPHRHLFRVVASMTLVAVAACGGESSATSHDGGGGRDGNIDRGVPGDALREAASSDSTADRLHVPDVHAGHPMDASIPLDGAGPFDSGTSAYPPPPPDAAKFDGCAPDPCGSADLCISLQSTVPKSNTGLCYNFPTSCDAGLTCLCVVQAAWWCMSPTCSEDGGFTLACHYPAPP